MDNPNILFAVQWIVIGLNLCVALELFKHRRRLTTFWMMLMGVNAGFAIGNTVKLLSWLLF